MNFARMSMMTPALNPGVHVHSFGPIMGEVISLFGQNSLQASCREGDISGLRFVHIGRSATPNLRGWRRKW